MYAKSITKTKKGWKCNLFTSEGGPLYTIIEGDRLTDIIESIDEYIKSYVEWKKEKGHDNTVIEEKKEFRY